MHKRREANYVLINIHSLCSRSRLRPPRTAFCLQPLIQFASIESKEKLRNGKWAFVPRRTIESTLFHIFTRFQRHHFALAPKVWRNLSDAEEKKGREALINRNRSRIMGMSGYDAAIESTSISAIYVYSKNSFLSSFFVCSLAPMYSRR